MNSILKYYEEYDEDKRLFKSNMNKLEFITTIEKLNSIIKSGDKIIELGAGTGNYSFYYNDKGHEVVALDIVLKHVEIIEQKIKEKNSKKIKTYLGSAIDLSEFSDESFDVVLCLGPMYHLTSVEDQRSCIKESRRILKKDGVLAIAYINKHYILANTMLNNNYLKESFIEKTLTSGVMKSGDEGNFWVESNYFTPKEIEKFVDKIGFRKISNIATDGIGRLFSEKVNSFSEKEFEIFKNYHLASCDDESLLGYSNHGLYIVKKS
ncbi:class I SAM-dependent methyltransferase [Cetobacterium sp.]|uniref:class I SAM-dependent methyltransferase n=3 Tax=Cetobacterium sp. TaxID=2071632 RepID=UPI0025B7BEDD|nr:class I SAM-dependent methyltransferase [Cetobacterium sp.]